MRATRDESKIPLNPFTAGVYVATMMATVEVSGKPGGSVLTAWVEGRGGGAFVTLKGSGRAGGSILASLNWRGEVRTRRRHGAGGKSRRGKGRGLQGRKGGRLAKKRAKAATVRRT